jgi:hypothetical protein
MLFVVARALPVLSNFPGRDQGTYLTIGRSLLQGRILYRDLWENKPPGIFYLYAPITKIFGLRLGSVAAVDLALLLFVSWCVFRFTERRLGPMAAAVAVAIHAAWHVEAGYIFTSQPEFFQLPLIFGAYFLVEFAVKQPEGWRVRHLMAGVLLGGAFWLKYNAIFFLPLLIIPYLKRDALDGAPPRLVLRLSLSRFVERAAWIAAGLALMVVVVLGYFGMHGAFPALREIQFEVLPRYAAMAAERRRLPLGEWIAVRSEFFLGSLTLAATAVALVVARARRDLARALPTLGGAALAYTATASQISFHSYYFATCYPFFAMIWAYVFLNLWEGFRAASQACARRRWRVAQALVWVLFANLLYWPLPREAGAVQMDYVNLSEWRRDPQNFYANHNWSIPFEHTKGQLELIRYLRANAAPGDEMFLWGGHTLICYLADQPCVTRFVSNLGLMSLWAPQAWRDEVARELRARPPRWIVVARDDALPSITFVFLSSDGYLEERYPELDDLVRSEYRPAADFGTFVVYQRKPGQRARLP